MKTIKATYHDGSFHPFEPVSLPEGATVEIFLPEPDATLSVTDRFKEVIGAFPTEELAKMQADIEDAFGKVDHDAWK